MSANKFNITRGDKSEKIIVIYDGFLSVLTESIREIVCENEKLCVEYIPT